MITMVVDEWAGVDKIRSSRLMISLTSFNTSTTWLKTTGSSPPSIFWQSSKLSLDVIWCGTLLGSVFSMCCTVACRLYRNGATTKIENIGGGVVLAGGDTTGCKKELCFMVTEESFESGPVSLDPGDSGEGMLSFIVVVEGTDGSGT
jgi:hypothetical protein